MFQILRTLRLATLVIELRCSKNLGLYMLVKDTSLGGYEIRVIRDSSILLFRDEPTQLATLAEIRDTPLRPGEKRFTKIFDLLAQGSDEVEFIPLAPLGAPEGEYYLAPIWEVVGGIIAGTLWVM